MSRRPNLAVAALAVTALAACLAAGCDGAGAEARREYYRALELSKTGQPLEAQLAHVERAVALQPDAATYLEKRAGLLFALGRLAPARADYDRAIELADRPYLRFERADLLCSLGEHDAALADLDRAIAAQPENLQFYPRRALARLAAGRVAEARADVEHATKAGFPAPYARAAVRFVEGSYGAALSDLDAAVEQASDPSHGALPRTLRMLALAALGQHERAAELDQEALAAAERWPEMGYRHWLVPRGCDNAFLATQAGPLVSRALASEADSQR